MLEKKDDSGYVISLCVLANFDHNTVGPCKADVLCLKQLNWCFL